jgi:riboflavin kinase/FMN adenylyltransferase
MEILRGPAGLAPAAGASVVAIGNFDGVHLGHQALVAAVLEATALGGGTPTVLTFEPHPREVLARAQAMAPSPVAVPARLQRLREKVPVLAALGVQRLVVARFNDRLRLHTPEAFVAEFLVGLLRARHVVVGEGFRFGHRGAGTVDFLKDAGVRFGFTVQAVPLVSLQGVAVSSTAVREALDAGNLPFAAQLLGRPYAVTARVQRGKQLGRTLGYPTLNLRLHRRRVPLGGIFAVRVTGGGLDHWPGVASLGTRPTVDVDGEVLLEVHLFDWQGDLYGAHVTVEFVAWQRPELRFDSLDALVLQMDEDSREARRRLAAA